MDVLCCIVLYVYSCVVLSTVVLYVVLYDVYMSAEGTHNSNRSYVYRPLAVRGIIHYRKVAQCKFVMCVKVGLSSNFMPPPLSLPVLLRPPPLNERLAPTALKKQN